jgi:hypothetical protein
LFRGDSTENIEFANGNLIHIRYNFYEFLDNNPVALSMAISLFHFLKKWSLGVRSD